MKRSLNAFLAAIALAVFVLVPTAFAQSASGAFHLAGDESNRKVEFNAKLHPNGSASGDLKFSGSVSIPDQDVDGDGTGDPVATAQTLSLKVDVDCLKVEENRAVLGGKVRDSNFIGYIGRRVLFTVEDGGEGKNAAPDRYTWGQYRSTTQTWTPSDAELAFDPGVGLTWIATDFERTNDAGIPSHPPSTVDCKSFPLRSYALDDLPQGTGNVQVKP
jgi:hypothetical protein